MSELARLVDPSELDAISGPHGKVTIERSTADLGEEVVVPIPRRLACARCEGGGCDSCGRSGAIRLDRDDATVRFVLPREAGKALRVRLLRPLGDDAELALLTVEVKLTATTALARAPSSALARGAAASPSPFVSLLIAAAVAIAAAIAIAAGLR